MFIISGSLKINDKFYGCWNINDKLIYISSPLSNQGLPAVTSNEFLFIHPKSQCFHIVYTIITAIPTCNLRFL